VALSDTAISTCINSMPKFAFFCVSYTREEGFEVDEVG